MAKIQFLYLLLLLLLEVDAKTKCATNTLLQENELQQDEDAVDCLVWFFYNDTTNQCECYNSIPDYHGPDSTQIKCVEQRTFIFDGYIITYSNDESTCQLFSVFYQSGSFTAI